MYYTIDYPKFLELQQSLIPIVLNAKINVHAYNGPYTDEVQEFIDFLGTPPVIHETFRLPEIEHTHCHRDFSAGVTYDWSVNIPIIGYENSYTHFWTTTGRPKKPNNLWVWEVSESKLLSSYATTKIFVMDTRVPHSIHNETERFSYMLRMPIDWQPTDINGLLNYEG